jgi:hypothetical protein
VGVYQVHLHTIKGSNSQTSSRQSPGLEPAGTSFSRDPGWVEIFWNNVPNGLRIMDQCGFPREEHLLESHRERGFIIPEGYKPLAGGKAVGRHPRKTGRNEPTPKGVAGPSIKIPRVVFNTGFFQELDDFLAE